MAAAALLEATFAIITAKIVVIKTRTGVGAW